MLLKDKALVQAVLKDFQSSPLEDKEKKLFAFIRKVNREAGNIGPSDIEELKQAGWPEEAIYDAVNVCALFNLYNRWVDATGVHAQAEEATEGNAKRLAEWGYWPGD